MTNKEQLEKLVDEAIDVAEQMLKSHDDDAFVDLLEEFDIKLKRSQAEDLLSRCHSAVVNEIVKYVKEETDRDPSEIEDDEDEEYDPEDYADPQKEADAWQDTLVAVKNSPCPKCDGTESEVKYNTHNGEYCTYDTVCKKCGYVILSQLD